MVTITVLLLLAVMTFAPIVAGVVYLVIERHQRRAADVWSAESLDAEARIDAMTRQALFEMRAAARAEFREQRPVRGT